MYGQKIRMVREMRGFKQEHLASELGISQNTYSKYETDQIRISAETLEKIAKILDVNLTDLTSQQPVIVNLRSNKGVQYADNVITNQKELYDEMLASKNAEIDRYREMNEKLKEIINTLQNTIDNLSSKK